MWNKEITREKEGGKSYTERRREEGEGNGRKLMT